MFTGIIEAVGRIREVQARGDDRSFVIATPQGLLEACAAGDSIAVAGVCLTAVAVEPDAFVADVSVETLQLTTAGRWAVASPVNLERALTPQKPLGGHFVSGHVDGLGRLLSVTQQARSRRLEFELPQALSRYVARKGSVTIDGISLTVNEVEGNRFGVNIIPHTWTQTTLATLRPGDPVNIEVDLIARYLERLMAGRAGT